MVMKALREGAAGGIGKFFLMGFMAVAVGGLVMMDIGGFFRNGGVSNSDVAKVGRQTIPIAQFDRLARMTLQRVGMQPQEAYKVGYIQQILNGQIRDSLLSQTADKVGVMVSKEQVAKEIKDMIEPMAKQGQSPQQILNQVLMNQGISEAQFVNSVRQEMSNSLLTRSINAGFTSVPDDLTKDLYLFQNEKRSLEYAVFPDSDLKDVKPPTEEELKSLYDSTKEGTATPETRVFDFVTVKTDSVKNNVQVSDADVKKSYEDNIDTYTVPKSWTLDQAVLSSKEQADAVAAAAKSGKALDAAVQSATGNKTAYLGQKAVDGKSVQPELKAAVIDNGKPGDVVGPTQSALGWYVVKIAKIEDAKTKGFDEVKDDIRKDLIASKTVDQQYALSNTVDDMLAGGSSVDDVAKQVDLDIKVLPPITHFGMGNDGKDALKEYEKIRNNILESGFNLSNEGETSPIFETPDGHYMAVSLQTLTPKTYMPYEEAKKELTAQYMTDNKRLANQDRIRKYLAEMTGGGKSLKEVAQEYGKSVQTANGFTRSQQMQSPLTNRATQVIFEAPVKAPFLLDADGGMALAVVTEAKVPENVDEKSADYKQLHDAVTKNTQNEASLAYVNEKQKEYTVRVNENLLQQTYGASKDQQPDQQ